MFPLKMVSTLARQLTPAASPPCVAPVPTPRCRVAAAASAAGRAPAQPPALARAPGRRDGPDGEEIPVR